MFVRAKVIYCDKTQPLIETMRIGIKNKDHVPKWFRGHRSFVYQVSY